MTVKGDDDAPDGGRDRALGDDGLDADGLRVQVMGAGALGSLVGGVLASGGLDVHLVGRGDHVAAVERDGLVVTGERELTARPTAATTPCDADVTLVTVKARDTRDAAETVRGRQGVAVSLQNGLGNEEVLVDELDCTVLAGTTTYGARYRTAGTVACTGEGEVAIGARSGGQSETAERLAGAFGEAGLSTIAAADMPRRLWLKCAVNAGINPVTALTGLTNGEAVHRAGDVVREAAEETARVAGAAGVDLEPSEAADEAIRVARATAANRSSMLQDLETGRRTEVDAINGAVVDRAAELGVEAPVNRSLAALVRAATHRS